MRRACQVCQANGTRTMTTRLSSWTVRGGVRIPCEPRPVCRACEREARAYPQADPLDHAIFAGPVLSGVGAWHCKFHPDSAATGSATLADGRIVTLCPACTARLGSFQTNTLGVCHFVPGMLSAHDLGDRCECDPIVHAGVAWHRHSTWLESRAGELIRSAEEHARAAGGRT